MWCGCSNTDPPEIALRTALITFLYTLQGRSIDYCCPFVTSPRVGILKERTFILFDCTHKRYVVCLSRDKWAPVTTEWRVLGLRMEERPPMWRVAANVLNKQSRIIDKGWSCSFGVGRGANNSSPQKLILLRNIHR